MAHSAINLPSIPLQPTARPGYRLVPALVGRSTDPGVIAHVECPDWCTVDHVADRSVFLEDINHQGEHTALNLPSDHPARVPVEVHLSWWPASRDIAAKPCLSVDIDTEVMVYGRTAALALADQIVSFAADVRRLAESLPADDGDSDPDMDEALRRVRKGRQA
ncbi:hypothetical protein [Streptomyces sp. AVP053U2]|uniref:DUF6907 domain-containing protein n=1 Tax=Streptomyces sp. AVP053U2 TaxID=1737066 RepID=UPI00073BA57E|nr:hypothetical protein [Streptomyces sp. AVP053U2]ODA75572.1 hypothetical protein APS67_000135 [Streptomyces sp. AVP053U2]